MTQQVHSCCSNLCKKCNQTKPCAWLSLGNEYCDEIIIIDSLLCKLKYNNDNLQQIIDKAIEYIEVLDKNEFETIDDVIVLDNYLSDLLDILRGEDNE